MRPRPRKVMKSAQELKRFTAYCNAHPDERFWQALRNFSGWDSILVTVVGNKTITLDTFYWEETKRLN